MGLIAYRACRMSGRNCKELVIEAYEYKRISDMYGIKVLDPVLMERIPALDKPLQQADTLIAHWKHDKLCLQQAHVLISSNATEKSIGAEHEMGLFRFGYWKPLILVFPDVKELPYIARTEDDLVVKDFYEACYYANKFWGTKWKRFVWRITMLNKSLPVFFMRQLKFLFQ